MPRVRRGFRLVRPGPQLRLIASFGILSALALFLQYMLFARVLAQLARELPGDGELLLERADGLLLTLLVGSFAVLLPITLLVGMAAASRWAGPLGRLESFLRAVARGEAPPDVELRRGDELKELAGLLNQVTAPLRGSVQAPADASAADEAASTLVERKAA